jgi:hypothetical protein
LLGAATGVVLGAGALGIYLFDTQRYDDWRAEARELPAAEDANLMERVRLEDNAELRKSIETWDTVAYALAAGSVVALGASLWIYVADERDMGSGRQVRLVATPAGLRLDGRL